MTVISFGAWRASPRMNFSIAPELLNNIFQISWLTQNRPLVGRFRL